MPMPFCPMTVRPLAPTRLALFALALLHFTFDSLCCIGFSAFSSLSASPYYSFCCGPNFAPSNLVAKGVPNVPISLNNDNGEKKAQKCQNEAFSAYRTNELRRLVTLYQLNEAVKNEKRAAEKGATQLSCSFDLSENCAWQNAKSPQSMRENESFVKARFESAQFNWDKFECTGERAFPLEGFFLLAGGRGEAANESTAAIEAKVPCQTEKAMLKFDYWSINETPTLKVCVVPEKSVGPPQCEESKMDINPLTFEIPQNARPFRLRIEVDNIVGRDDIVFIDNIQYDGNGKKNICQKEQKIVPKNAVNGLLLENKREKLAIADYEKKEFDAMKKKKFDNKEEEVQKETEDEQMGRDQHGKKSLIRSRKREQQQLEMFGPISENEGIYQDKKAKQKKQWSQNRKAFGQHSGDIHLSSVRRRTKNGSDEPLFGPEFASLCEALKCNFNDGKACHYKFLPIGGISKWKIANGPVGNVHTGIHKNSRGETKLVGFAFVGSDLKETENETFVLGSPKLSVDEPVSLMFDLFQRSVGPQLRICLNMLWNCSYENPTKPDKVKHWLIGQKVTLPRGTERVFFLASKLRRNHFIAVDNIRVQRMKINGEICDSEEKNQKKNEGKTKN